MDLGIITIFSVLLVSSVVDVTVGLRGPNVCTQIQSVVKFDRIPTGGIMTSKIRYTTRCLSMIGMCSKYRIVYVPGYIKKTKLKYRVAQICCSGFVEDTMGRCVRAPPPPPPTPKKPKIYTTPTSARHLPGGNPVHADPAARGGGVPDPAARGGWVADPAARGGGGLPPDPAFGPGVQDPAFGPGVQDPAFRRGVQDPAFGPGNPVFEANPGENGANARNGVSGTQGTRNTLPNGPGIRQGSGPWVGLGPRTPIGGNDRNAMNNGNAGNNVNTGRNGYTGNNGNTGRNGNNGNTGRNGDRDSTGTQRTATVDRNYPRSGYPNQPVHRDRQSGSTVDGVYPDINVNGAINDGPNVNPDYQPRGYDPVMAFVSTATAAIGLLTLASTILGVFLLYRRQQMAGGYGGGKPFGSFKSWSMGSGKSIETQVEMQTLTGVDDPDKPEMMEIKKKSTKPGKSRSDCPYVDIEQMRNAAAELDSQDSTQLLASPTGNTSGNNSKGLKRSRRTSSKKRSLPPEPPTYAVVHKPKKTLTPSLSDGKETCMPVMSLSGQSSSLTASLEGPLSARESAHIYAQINRKSKGVSSTWSRSSSLPSRPTTLVSNPDNLQNSSSYRALESFTRSLGRATQKLELRRSGCESSGYSSLQESKETLLYDTCSRKENKTPTGVQGVQPAALYRSLTEKGLCGRTVEYDQLSRCVKGGTTTTDASISRGYATLTSVDATVTDTPAATAES